MKPYVLFKQSLKAISSNKVRSFLTVLGIVIGIGSVIALVSFGTGIKASISDRIAMLGTTNLTVMPGAAFDSSTAHNQNGDQSGGGVIPTASTLTVIDLNSLADQSKHPQIKAVSGQISGSAILTTANGERRYTVQGTSETYAVIQNLSISKGDFYKQAELNNKSRVIVLGSQMAEELFGAKNAVGEKIMISENDYTIIGVLQETDESAFNNPNNQAYIPYTAAAETFKTQNFNSIMVQALNENVVDVVKADVKKTLLKNHQIKDAKLADFNVITAADLLSTVNGITSMLTALLAGIAAISLLVGGIGIMNIMLVSVTERTREIGLRKAVGAKTSDILSQFIMEAVLLTICGGILGIGLGFLIGKMAAPSLGFAPIVSNNAIVLAVGVSSMIGLVFGVYPAAKASLLNPIDALRYE